jgi:hypothetical protein
MNTTNQVLESLKGGPLNKTAITEATGIKGLPLFNLIKQMVKDGQVTAAGEGNDAVYSIPAATTDDVMVSPAIEVASEVQVAPSQATVTETPSEQPNPAPPAEVKNEGKKEDVPAITKTTGRNNDKFSFNGISDLGKGALARAIVEKYVKDNPNTTYKKLMEVFPTTLLKRFGVVEDIEKAREISGKKYDRYFFKEEHVIKLKDKKVVVTNQWTSENILPLLQVAKELGYTIN